MGNNLDIIENTLDICKKRFYYIDDKKIELALDKEQMEAAVVFTDNQIGGLIADFDSTNIILNKKTNYQVCNMGSFEAAFKMNYKFGNSKTLVLNFANPVNPGGGVRIGATAQEEDLCRKSTLLLSLESEKAKKYYDFHRKQRSYLSSNYMIISPTVEVFRSDDNSLSTMPFIISVLSCAAPIMTENIRNMGNKQYEAILYQRIKGMLCLALEQGYENLVLGAWGCGAFGNDAEVMARLFYKVLNELKAFNKVVMAVLDRSVTKYNYLAFEKYFGNLSE